MRARRARRPRPNPGYVARVNEGGNFCGHNPASPCLSLTEPASDKLPWILRELMRRVLDYYDNPLKTIPTLNSPFGNPRRHRSDGRESCLRMLLAILKFTDLVTLCVGVPTPAGLGTMSIETLGRHAGLSPSRAARAVARLKAAGLVSVTRMPPQGDSWEGPPAIKAVRASLWGCFGLLTKLGESRAVASKKIATEGRKLARKMASSRGKARIDLALGAVKNMLSGSRRSGRAADPGAEFEQKRRLAIRCNELRLEHPDWPPEKIRSIAQQELS